MSKQVILGGAASGATAMHAGEPQAVDVDIVVPVYNEQAELGSSVITLVQHMRDIASSAMPCTWQVVIADNASTDNTWWISRSIAQAYPGEVRAVRVDRKGRGLALKRAWGESRAQVVAYMDVDLSTDLSHIPELVGPLLNGVADVSFGSRLMPGSRVKRSFKREFISRTYNRMLQMYLGVSFRDAQCGFKALSCEAATLLLPQIVDDEWFFDTELLTRSERAGLAMCEIPVRWVEDAGSTVHIADTVRKDLAGMYRLKHERMDAGDPHGPLGRHCAAQHGAGGPFVSADLAQPRVLNRGEVTAR